LEIDELAYLDEMADLIARSTGLKELRVGISAKAVHKDFAQTWDGSTLQQIDHNARWPGESTVGERRLGGVLGVLVGRIYDIRRRSAAKCKEKVGQELPPPSGTAASWITSVLHQEQAEDSEEIPPLSNSTPAAASAPQGGVDSQPASAEQAATDLPRVKPSVSSKSSRSNKINSAGRKKLDGKLKLDTLELERVALSMHVCRYAIDWTVLTSVTILDCAQHETLWKMLKKQYQPTPRSSGFGISATTRPASPNAALEYHLKLKSIHTDATSAALISFIKETLEPNSLEVLFLQDRKRGSHPPQVTFDQIFKGAIKRHRSSLRKLLIDSSQRPSPPGATTVENTRWRTWVLPTETMLYISSGRMSNLRELAVSLDYKDWVSKA
jgi:hypothetical protein